jgi:hypothetical protein
VGFRTPGRPRRRRQCRQTRRSPCWNRQIRHDWLHLLRNRPESTTDLLVELVQVNEQHGLILHRACVGYCELAEVAFAWKARQVLRREVFEFRGFHRLKACAQRPKSSASYTAVAALRAVCQAVSSE